MDMTGYGRSTRPPAMNDPCNLSKDQQIVFVPSLLTAPCSASYGQQMTTLASDWNDIGGVVDYLLANRKVAKLSLIGWSLGGPRSGGFAAQHQDKIDKIVLLAPAFNRNGSAAPPGDRTCQRSGLQHTVPCRIYGELGASGRVSESD